VRLEGICRRHAAVAIQAEIQHLMRNLGHKKAYFRG